MGRILLEVCCGSADDVIQAYRAGASRVELNSDLFHGGLTPTLGELIVAKRETGMQIMAMVRPREGGFCYTEGEFATAVEDAKLLLAHGADGLVFGFLHQDGTLDRERTRVLAGLAQAAGKESVFHRAIDVVPDWPAALDQLISLGITRVLTSGQEADVSLGTDTVREMIRYAGGRIQILPGAGITARNMDRIIAETGCSQIHLAAHKIQWDTSVNNNRAIYYGGALYPPEDRFQVIDSDYIGSMVKRLPD
ncbi:MAG: copper homeostasis protein CutC [Angelakisella sp.]|jgi:copper homeostasis protein|nr:copper homeostasis protein CutC [Angelakisella sp.]